MPRARKSVPSYLLHPQSGSARAVWTDSGGVRHYRLLPGAFESQESRAAFARLQLEFASSPAAVAKPHGSTINEVLLAYLDYAEQHYRGTDGKPTDEIRHVKTVCHMFASCTARMPLWSSARSR
jgi:hypothetical protein